MTTGIQGLSLGGGILNHLPEDRYFPWQRIHLTEGKISKSSIWFRIEICAQKRGISICDINEPLLDVVWEGVTDFGTLKNWEILNQLSTEVLEDLESRQEVRSLTLRQGAPLGTDRTFRKAWIYSEDMFHCLVIFVCWCLLLIIVLLLLLLLLL